MSYIRTYGGVRFSLLYPRPEMMRLEDVGRSLSGQNRWLNHTRLGIKTAQHSVLVGLRARFHAESAGLGPELENMAERAGFAHDFTEAWYGDVSSPLKQTPELAGYRKLEDYAMAIVGVRWAIDFWNPIIRPLWERADQEIAGSEARDLLNGDYAEYQELISIAAPQTVVPLSEEDSLALFMETARRLGFN